jgi:DNA-binding NarL/FixJ family response regulator
MGKVGQAGFGKRRVMIVDDHPIIREGLAQFLARDPDIEICGGTDNAADALRQIEDLCPHLVVVDITLKDSHGLGLIADIHSRYKDVRTLVWSMFDEKAFAERALRAGAMGYVNKKEPIESVVEAVRVVLRGEICLSPQMTASLLRRIGKGEPLEEDPVRTMTNRQMQVFTMIGNGMTTKQIARKLNLSPKTVEAHRENIKEKLNLANAAELSCRAVQWVMENG